jgi:type II secretory pathway component PulJ
MRISDQAKSYVDRNSKGVSLVEILIAFTLFGLVLATMYRSLFHYTRSYFAIMEKSENVAESWQIIRCLNDDILTTGFPEGKLKNWEKVFSFDEDTFKLNRQRMGADTTILYHFDRATGSISREEDGVRLVLLKNRCQEFKIEIHQVNSADGNLPEKVWCKVKIVIGNKTDDSSKKVELKTNLFPVFANILLEKNYCHEYSLASGSTDY